MTVRSNSYWDRRRVNYQTRACLWGGQSWDARKWAQFRGGEEPFPWNGASDARVPLVDHYIELDYAMLMLAWRTQRVSMRSTNPAQDRGHAAKLTALLRWQIYDQMDEAEDEARLLANYLLETGAAALGVFWERSTEKVLETLTMDDILRQAQQAQQALRAGQMGDAIALQARLPEIVMDPTQEPLAVEIYQAALAGEDGETMDPKRVLRVVRDLRVNGEAKFPKVVVVRDQPRIRALEWNHDVFIPVDTQNPRMPRITFMRELLTEGDMVERARALGWDKDWVDKVMASQRGVTSEASIRKPDQTSNLAWGANNDLFEVVSAFRRLYDDDEVPSWWITTFSPGLGNARPEERELVGAHEQLDYAHNESPIHVFALERRSRIVDESRGYGEKGGSFQDQVKRQWDAQIDRADIATLPPFHHPPNEKPDDWGPGVQIPTLQPDRYGFFEVPQLDRGSDLVLERVRGFADAYFGHKTETGDPVSAMNLKGELVATWLSGWRPVFRQILQLDQQYMPDEVYAAIVGSNQGQLIRITRQEIQGGFGLMTSFSVKAQDPEYIGEILGFMERAAQLDVSGRMDRDEALQAAFELIDPGYAERLLQPKEAASLKQVDDEQLTLMKLVMGIPVDVKGNEAFALRKQVLTQTIQQSPTLQQMLASNPDAQKAVLTRLQQLEFNDQQRRVNPVIGRTLGSKPMQQVMGGQQ